MSAEDQKPAFDLLFRPDATVWTNLTAIALYVDRFAKSLGLTELTADTSKLTSVAGALTRPDFPHADGLEKASPFKKAAHFFVWFVGQRPIIDELPAKIIGEDLAGIKNHQNAIFAYHLAIDCLEGAKIFRSDSNEEPITLEKRIRVSYHFFRDFIEAYASAVPEHDFKKISLLFEQMAYRDNSDASYPQII